MDTLSEIMARQAAEMDEMRERHRRELEAFGRAQAERMDRATDGYVDHQRRLGNITGR